jgi:transcriptional regulator with XRE-family HTH domain
MSQITQVTETLKQLLKEKKLTYRHVADALSMSEANIKRIFSTQSFSLDKLEQICDVIGLTLADLFALTQKQTQQISQLTVEQEQQLLSDPKLLLAAVCVRDGWSFEDIVQHYDISEHECIRLFVRLDKLSVIELLPNNRYRQLISQDFRWIPGGPLAKFMEQEVMVKFMAPKQGEKWNFRFYLRGRYSKSSVDIIERKLNQLTKEAAELNREDADLPVDERQHMGLLLAMRPWEPSLFENMRRKAD